MDRLLTPAQVAEMAGCSRGTVNNHMLAGKLPFVQVDGLRRVAESVATATYGADAPAPVVKDSRVRYRVFSKEGRRAQGAILFTCRERATAQLMAAGCPGPVRIAAVRV